MFSQDDMKRLVGAADMFELASVVFAFPDKAVAEGLSSGALQADVRACLQDAGVAPDEACLRVLDGVRDCKPDELFEELRIAYSLTFLAPGKPPVYLYESAFVHEASGRTGVATLFRSPSTLDVERLMREAEVLPADYRTIPCDAMPSECAYMAHALGSAVAALQRDSGDEATVWLGRAAGFMRAHGAAWFAPFCDAAAHCGKSGVYGAFARCMSPFMRQVGEGFSAFGEVSR